MISFDCVLDFFDFYKDLNIYEEWKLLDTSNNARGAAIYSKRYTEYLRELFSKKNLFRRNVSIAEIVSWLDNFILVKRIISKLKDELPLNVLGNIRLHCEYKIELSKSRRIDFVFQYKCNILLVEFRFSDKFPNLSNVWQKKEIELIIYKELLMNYLPRDYRVFVYAFIGMPEYSGKTPLLKHIKYNNDNINHICKYIASYLVNFKEGEKKNADIINE